MNIAPKDWNFEFLPWENLIDKQLFIHPCLDHLSLLALSATCSYLKEKVHTTPSLWRRLDLHLNTDWGLRSHAPLRLMLKSKGMYTRMISISSTGLLFESLDEMLDLIKQYCRASNITSLSISHMNFDILERVVQLFPALVSLKIGQLIIGPNAFRRPPPTTTIYQLSAEPMSKVSKGKVTVSQRAKQTKKAMPPTSIIYQLQTEPLSKRSKDRAKINVKQTIKVIPELPSNEKGGLPWNPCQCHRYKPVLVGLLTQSATRLHCLKSFDVEIYTTPVKSKCQWPVPPLSALCSHCKQAVDVCISKDFILPLVKANLDLKEVRLRGVKVDLPVMR